MFFESMECLKKDPPLSSCRVILSEDRTFPPSLAPDLYRALSKAKRKMRSSLVKVASASFSAQISGVKARGGYRMEGCQMGSGAQ